MNIEQPLESDPSYLKRALSLSGLREIPGPQHNEKILELWSVIPKQRWPKDELTDEHAWCAVTVCWALETSGWQSPRRPAAHSFLTYGRAHGSLDDAERGMILIFDRDDPKNPNAKHVGFYLAHTSTDALVYSGNQNNRCGVKLYSLADLEGIRVPAIGDRMPGMDTHGGAQP